MIRKFTAVIAALLIAVCSAAALPDNIGPENLLFTASANYIEELENGALEMKEEESGDYRYVVLNDGTAEITRFIYADKPYWERTSDNFEDADNTKLIVPAEIDGIKVSKIGDAAFYGCSNIQVITISEGIEKLGLKTIYDCPDLKIVNIPGSMTNLGLDNFELCPSLEEYNVNENNSEYTSIDGILYSKNKTELYYFPANYQKNDFTFPDELEIITMYSFSNNKSLKSITIPYGVTKIEDWAFRSCENLQSVSIPNTVTEIGDGAFVNCPMLKSLYIPDSVTYISSYENIGYYYDYYMGTVKLSDFKILCGSGSEAERYAVSENIAYEIVDASNSASQTLNEVISNNSDDGSEAVGDVNGDGRTTVGDILQLASIIKDSSVISQEEIFYYDINNDGKITVSDILKIADIIKHGQ